MAPRLKPWQAKFEDAILYQESIKNTTWEKPFNEFVLSKAEQYLDGCCISTINNT